MNGQLSQVAGAYLEWRPVQALREHVRCLWVNDLTSSPVRLIQIVPDGCVDIIWTEINGLRVAGPDTQPILETASSHRLVVGIRFHPGRAFSWLGVPLEQLLNSRVPLSEFWNDSAGGLADEMSEAGNAMVIARRLEAALLARLPQVEPADRCIAFLARAASGRCNRGPLGMAELARQIGMSERTLRRRCVDSFGYGLKTLGRIMRFQRFFRLAIQSADEKLVDLAMLAGFADQAHLAREVQRLGGATPSQFLAQLRS